MQHVDLVAAIRATTNEEHSSSVIRLLTALCALSAMSAARFSFRLRQQAVAFANSPLTHSTAPLRQIPFSSSLRSAAHRPRSHAVQWRRFSTEVSAAIPATPATDSHIADSYEFIAPPTASSSVPALVTCEHASNAFPASLPLPAGDSRLAGMHWAVDIGAEELTRELSQRLSVPALLSRVSRLVVDVNRPLNSDTLMRTVADGKPIELNLHLTPHDFEDRISKYYLPYHLMMKEAVKRYSPHFVIAIHSFTPEYEGQRRHVEMGVLYKRAQDEPYAKELCRRLREAGIRAELNEPWSGVEGFMFAVDSLTHTHAHLAQSAGGLPAVEEEDEAELSTAHGGHAHKVQFPAATAVTGSSSQRQSPTSSSSTARVQYPVATLMLEARQDLIVQPRWRQQVMDILQQFVDTQQTAKSTK